MFHVCGQLSKLNSKIDHVQVKNHPGAATNDIIDYIKPTICQKADIVIIHSGTNDWPVSITRDGLTNKHSLVYKDLPKILNSDIQVLINN